MMRLISALAWRWPLWALIAAATLLGIAHAFETFGHLSPCELCLKQRDAYWAAMGVAAVGLALSYSPVKARRLVCLLLAGVFLTGAGVAVYQAGAEWKFWPGPSSCSGGGAVSMADLNRLLHGGHRTVVRCDQAAWIFLGLSMAGWNALISIALAGMSLGAARTRTP